MKIFRRLSARRFRRAVNEFAGDEGRSGAAQGDEVRCVPEAQRAVADGQDRGGLGEGGPGGPRW
jgi:hypothetical protein